MRINTLTVWDMTGDELVEIHNESYEYDGEVSEAKGGGSSTTNTVQSADPWKGVQPNIKDIVARAEGLSNTPQEYYPNQTFVSRNPYEDAGAMQALQYGTQGMLPQIGQAQNAQSFMLNAPDVANNPYVNAQADVITNRLNQQYNEQVMPGISSGAIGAGQFGGSRQGVAEGIASRGLQQSTGDALASLYGDAYGQGLEQQAKGMAFAPQTMNLGFMPGQAMSQYGGYLRGEDEMQLAENMARHDFSQQEPWNRLSMYNSFVQGMPWSSSSTSTGTMPETGSTAGNMLGGGLLGYSLGSAGGPLAAIGAWPAAALGALGMGLFK